MPKALDITNQKFGKLTALSKVPSRSGKTYWLCQCECGNQKEIQTGHLTGGRTVSCGCLGAVNHLQVQDSIIEMICPICEEPFFPNNHKRKYCYNCSPEGLNAADRLRHLDRILKHKLISYKGGQCEKCGYNKCEGALQFHHTDPAEKEFGIANINFGKYFNMQKLQNEVDKCQLLCANCHAEEHYKKEQE